MSLPEPQIRGIGCAHDSLTVCAGSPAISGGGVETSEPYHPRYTDSFLLQKTDG